MRTFSSPHGIICISNILMHTFSIPHGTICISNILMHTFTRPHGVICLSNISLRTFTRPYGVICLSNTSLRIFTRPHGVICLSYISMRTFIRPQGVKSQKTELFIVTAIITSDANYQNSFSWRDEFRGYTNCIHCWLISLASDANILLRLTIYILYTSKFRQ
jgi:hypothetical protein